MVAPLLSHSLSKSLRKGRWKGSRGEKEGEEEGRGGRGKERTSKGEERGGQKQTQQKRKILFMNVKSLDVYAHQIESHLVCRRTSDYQHAAK